MNSRPAMITGLAFAVFLLAAVQPVVATRTLQATCSQIPQCAPSRCLLGVVNGKNQMQCERCLPGYSQTDNGLNCVCKAGSWHKCTTSGGDTTCTCEPCDKGTYCPGGVTTAKNFAPETQKGLRFSCHMAEVLNATSTVTPADIQQLGLTTKAQRSKRHSDCVPMPGFYLATTTAQLQAAELCPESTYSPGFGRIRKCLKCQAGTVENPTAGFTNNMTHATLFPSTLRKDRFKVCQVPPGTYLVQNVVRDCPAGTFRGAWDYTTAPGSRYCFSCPPGTTTNATRPTQPSDCNIIQSGIQYTAEDLTAAQASATSNNGTYATELKQCEYGFYFPGGTISPSNNQTCQPCPFGTTTQNKGSISLADCMVPPGYYVRRDRSSTDPLEGFMEKCPNNEQGIGYFRSGWISYADLSVQGTGIEACTPCGPGVLSEETDIDEMNGGGNATQKVAGSSFACYIEAGWGMQPTGVILPNNAMEFSAQLCSNNTYGVASKTYGLQQSPCKPCARNLITLQEGSTDPNQCVNPAGYGYNPTGANPCPAGYYNPLGSRGPCIRCPSGRSTEPNATLQQSIADCFVEPGSGLFDGTKNDTTDVDTTGLNSTEIAILPVLPCPVGYWSDGMEVDSKCVACPDGATTAAEGSTSDAACTKCKPGYGTDSSGTCKLCPAGTYQPGYLGNPDATNHGDNGYGELCIPCETTLSVYIGSNGKEQEITSNGTTYRKGATGREECVPTSAQLGIDAGTKLLLDDAKMTVAAALTNANYTLYSCMAACRAAATNNEGCIVQFDYGYFNADGSPGVPVCRYQLFMPSANPADASSKTLLFYKMLPSDAIAAASVQDSKMEAGMQAKAMASGLYARLEVPAAWPVNNTADDNIGTQLPGQSISIAGSKTLADCKQRCDRNARCWGFTLKDSVCVLRTGQDVQDTRTVFIQPSDTTILQW